MVGDFNPTKRSLRVGSRSVPLTQDAASAISAYLRVRKPSGERALFLSERDNPIAKRHAWTLVKKYIRECGLRDKTSPEILRASYAVHALEDGVYVLDVLSALGNVSIGTLQEYAKLAYTGFGEKAHKKEEVGFIGLLHPKIIQSSLRHYEDGFYRVAVLDAMLALTETIREKSGLDGDGVKLVSAVFRPENPILLFSERTTISGRDDHDGFHLIMLGAFQGIRNPKSHLSTSDLTEQTAAQYLVFISLLVRRVEEARRTPVLG
jgi:uncharacterized protein (TIGR02391 family)